MKSAERTFWTISLPLAAAGACAVLFFMWFSYGMGVGTFDNQDFVRFSRIATPAFYASVIWVPVCLVGVGVGVGQKWSVTPYVVLGAGCLLPCLAFLAATSLLY